MPTPHADGRASRTPRGTRSAESTVPSASEGARLVTTMAVGVADFAFLPVWHRWGARARHWMLRERGGRLEGAPVLLLPGVYESPRFLDPFAALAVAHGRPPHVVTGLGRNVQRVTDTAALAAGHLERHGLRDVLIIAHSKGGLVGKQLMAWQHTGWRVRGMIAIATPFSGSALATRAPVRALRDFSPADATLVELAADRVSDHGIVSVFPAFDPQIPQGSTLAGARANVRIPVSGHFRVLGHPELWRLLRRAVQASAERR